MSFRNLFSIILFVVLSSLSAQSGISKKNYDTISTAGFYDSSHHWYDINDEARIISPRPDQKRYQSNEITKIADNILLFQKVNGGWPKNYDMLAILTEDQKNAVGNTKNDLNSTFDNGATHAHIEYLVKSYFITKDEKYRAAYLRGLKFILSAQYPNGGWPQFFPDTSGYRKYITFNDGAMIGIMNLLRNFVLRKIEYAFIDQKFYNEIQTAFNKGLDCIINCQNKENGKFLVWCQQHDNNNFKPQSARTFEPASICNEESADIVLLLMSIKNPNKNIINAIQSAVRWFIDSKILGIRVKEVEAPKVNYQYHTTSIDKVVVQAENAPPIWTRYYELNTHKPLFCNRDGKPVYSLAEVDRERRTGYGWYTYAPQEVLNKYSYWQKKWAPDKNVLMK